MILFKKKSFKLFFVILTIYLFTLSFVEGGFVEGLFTIGNARANTMSNSEYKLDTSISNIYKDSQNNASHTQEKSIQTNPSVIIGENYKVIYPSNNSLFVLSISPKLIDYGILSPTNSVKRTSTITVLSQHLFGHTVTAVENNKLRNESSKTEIPDTSCDTGTCSVSRADLWNNSLTYGFGYRCDNLYDVPSCLNDFSNINYYKRFPNISESQNPYPVIQQTNAINSKGQITYQLNVSRTQETDAYNNSIIFMAIPNF